MCHFLNGWCFFPTKNGKASDYFFSPYKTNSVMILRLADSNLFLMIIKTNNNYYENGSNANSICVAEFTGKSLKCKRLPALQTPTEDTSNKIYVSYLKGTFFWILFGHFLIFFI